MIKLLRTGLILVVCYFTFNGAFGFSEVVDKVIAVINDEVLTQREFNRTFEPLKQQIKERFEGKELQENIEMAKKDILEQLVSSKLIISLAKAKNVEIDEAELEERIDKIKAYYASEQEFLMTLNEKGMNLSEFEREIKDKMIAKKLVETEVASKIVITPGEIQELYNKNKEQLMTLPGVKTRGILIRKDVENEAEVKKKLKEVQKELKSGKDFAEVATKYSEGPYQDKGGDMGILGKGQVLKELDEVIFSLKEGETSDLIETSVGYHIVMVEKIYPSRQLELSEVSDYLRNQIFMKTFQENLYNWIQEKRKDAYIAYK